MQTTHLGISDRATSKEDDGQSSSGETGVNDYLYGSCLIKCRIIRLHPLLNLEPIRTWLKRQEAEKRC